MTDLFIIGTGPAGISSAIYAVRAGLAVTAAGKDAGSLGKTDKIENYYGFPEPLTGQELHDRGIAQASRLGAEILNTEVFDIEYVYADPSADPSADEAADHFKISTASGTYTSRALIMAAGTARKAPPVKGIKEFEGRGVSYCAVCDAFFYRNMKTAVIGNSQYAMNEAKHLLPTSAEVTMLTNGRELECKIDIDLISYGSPVTKDSSYQAFYAESVNDFEEGVYAKARDGGRFRIITGKISEVIGSDGVIEAVLFEDGSRIDIDGLFIAEGTASASDLGRKLGVAGPDGKLALNEDLSTFVPGFFAAGDCAGGMLQVAKAVYEGAQAAAATIKFLRSR